MSAETILNRRNLSAGQKRLQRWLHCVDDANDVVQTVSEKLLRIGTNPEPAYLATVFRNAAVDFIRADKTRRTYEECYAEQCETVDHLTPEHQLANAQALEALKAAIDELSPVNQEIFFRAYVEDQPRAEIADALGLRLSTIEKRLAKARRHCIAQIKIHIDPR